MTIPAPIPEFDHRDLTSFDRAGTSVGEFEQALLTYGITVRPHSDLEYICLEVLDLELKRLGRSPVDPMEDIRPMWRKAGSLIEIIQLFLRAHNAGRADPFLAHLQLLNDGLIAQNESIFPDRTDPAVFEASNKLFEMFFGLACSPLASVLSLDNPRHPKGDNPDVLATFAGRVWGFACKVISGQSVLTMYEHLQKGIDQIQNSPAEVGAVVFKLTNAVDHQSTWPVCNPDEWANGAEPIFGVRPNHVPVLQHLHSVHVMKHSELEQVNGRPAIEAIVRGKKSIPAAVTFLQTTTSVLSSHGPLVTTVGQLGLMEFDPVSQSDFDVIQRLNEVLHSRL